MTSTTTKGLKAHLKENLLFTTPIMYDYRKNIYTVVLNIYGQTDFVCRRW